MRAAYRTAGELKVAGNAALAEGMRCTKRHSADTFYQFSRLQAACLVLTPAIQALHCCNFCHLSRASSGYDALPK
eukprot:4819690-Amphidinium_carterae.1